MDRRICALNTRPSVSHPARGLTLPLAQNRHTLSGLARVLCLYLSMTRGRPLKQKRSRLGSRLLVDHCRTQLLEFGDYSRRHSRLIRYRCRRFTILGKCQPQAHRGEDSSEKPPSQRLLFADIPGCTPLTAELSRLFLFRRCD